MPLSKNYKFKEGTKIKLWFELYTDLKNEDTFLDPLESAIQAGYNCRSRVHFEKQGEHNLRRLKKFIEKKLSRHHPLLSCGLIDKTTKKITLELTPEEFSYLADKADLFDSTMPYVLKMLMRRGIAWEKQFDD